MYPCCIELSSKFPAGQTIILVIYWEICDQHQLLSSALQKISKSWLADDSNKPPAVITTSKLHGSPTLSVTTEQSTDFKEAFLQFGHQQSLIAWNFG
jgi:hypothetical protein